MIVVMKPNATEEEIAKVAAHIRAEGCETHLSEGKEHTIIGVIGNGRPVNRDRLGRMAGVPR